MSKVSNQFAQSIEKQRLPQTQTAERRGFGPGQSIASIGDDRRLSEIKRTVAGTRAK